MMSEKRLNPAPKLPRGKPSYDVRFEVGVSKRGQMTETRCVDLSQPSSPGIRCAKAGANWSQALCVVAPQGPHPLLYGAPKQALFGECDPRGSFPLQ